MSAKIVLSTATALVGLVLLLAALGDRAPARGAAATLERVDDSQGAPVVSGVHAPRPRPARAPVSGAPSREPAATPVATGGERGALLTVQLLGVGLQDLAGFEVSVTRAGATPIRAGVDDDGVAEVEVGALLEATRWAAGEALVVTARHAAYLDAVAIAPMGDDGARPSRVELTPRPASSFAGRVLPPPGVDPASVTVELLEPSGQPLLWRPDGSGERCDGAGRYACRSSAAGVHRLRVRAPRALPAEVWVELEPGHHLEVPDLVLDPGDAQIEGRVRWFDSRGPIGDQVHVLALCRDARPPIDEPPQVIRRDNAHTFRALRATAPPVTQTARVAADGTFVLGGIIAGTWELEVHGAPGHALLPLRAPRTVRAPARGVVLWDDRCVLTLELVGAPIEGGAAAAGARVRWTGDGSAPIETQAGDDGLVTVIGDASRDYAIEVTRPGAEPYRWTWPAAGRPGDALVRLELPPARPAELVLRPRGGSPAPGALSVRIEGIEPERVEAVHELVLESGVYRLVGLAPGRYAARIGPSDRHGPAAFHGDPLQSVTLEFEVAPGARLERELDLVPGGRVRIALAAPALAGAWLRCRLLGPDGRELAYVGVAEREATDSSGSWGSVEGALCTGTTNALRDALAPGRYALEPLDDAWTLEPSTFEIEPGATTRLAVTAHRSPR